MFTVDKGSCWGVTVPADHAEDAKKAAEKEVKLPEVVVMLDGKELHAEDPDAPPPEPEDDFSDAESNPDVEQQPKMLTEVRSITVLTHTHCPMLATFAKVPHFELAVGDCVLSDGRI